MLDTLLLIIYYFCLAIPVFLLLEEFHQQFWQCYDTYHCDVNADFMTQIAEAFSG